MPDSKILVISHNVFCNTSNMGKTLLSYFKKWKPEQLVQLYFHTEVPVSSKCNNYFRFTDVDALKSIINKNHKGKIFTTQNIEQDRISARSDKGFLKWIYSVAQKRTPLMLLLRDLIWYLSNWNSRALSGWIDQFKPDAIVFFSGDSCFSQNIAMQIAKKYHIPLIVSVMDDYYINNPKSLNPFRLLYLKLYKKCFLKLIAHCSCGLTICDKMAKDYEKVFHKQFTAIYNGKDFSSYEKDIAERKPSNRIAYLGSLSLGRCQQIADIGRALKSINSEFKPESIDVYSFINNRIVRKLMVPQNGITFHGMVSANEVDKIMKESMLLIHTESFQTKNKSRVAYSFSTKIPGCLSSGTCLLAYGPQDVASIQYLLENDVAYVITSHNELEKKLTTIINSEELRAKYIEKAFQIARNNHDNDINSSKAKSIIEYTIKQISFYYNAP